VIKRNTAKHYKRSRTSDGRIINNTQRPTTAHLNSFMPDGFMKALNPDNQILCEYQPLPSHPTANGG
jgi:hypothetical protein